MIAPYLQIAVRIDHRTSDVTGISLFALQRIIMTRICELLAVSFLVSFVCLSLAGWLCEIACNKIFI